MKSQERRRSSQGGPRSSQDGATRTDWRVYRPAIWLTMLAVAIALLVNPSWIAAAPLGAAIGIALKIHRQRS